MGASNQIFHLTVKLVFKGFNMKFKMWHKIAAAVVLLVSISFVYDFIAGEKNSNTGKILVKKNGVATFVDSETPLTSASQSKPSQKNTSDGIQVLPPRVLSAPSYDKLLMAARIENEAVDQESAKIFLGLQANRRNARLAAEVEKFKAEAKRFEADYEAAKARIKTSQEGKALNDNPDLMQVRSNAAIQNLTEGNSEKKDETSITLRHLDVVTSEMIIKVGDKWFNAVKPGQTIEGYLVGAIDLRLKCVPLTKGKELPNVICLN